MEIILRIVCVFSAIIVPGLLTKHEDLDAVKESVEKLLMERFLENTLRELYAAGDDKLENDKNDNEESARAYNHAKRFNEDFHARGTNATTTTTTPPPSQASSEAAATEAPTFNLCKRWWWSWKPWNPCKRSMNQRSSSFEKFRLLQRMLDDE